MKIKGRKVEIYFSRKFEFAFKRCRVDWLKNDIIIIKFGFIHIFIKTKEKIKEKHIGYQMQEKENHINKKKIDGRDR